MSLKILNLLFDFSLRAILKKFLILAHFQPPILIKMIVIKTNGVYGIWVCDALLEKNLVLSTSEYKTLSKLPTPWAFCLKIN